MTAEEAEARNFDVVEVVTVELRCDLADSAAVWVM